MRTTLLALSVGCLCFVPCAAAQVRGVYPTGMSATNSGGTPDPGYTYSNLFLFNARDKLLGPEGETVSTGHHALMIDLNTLVWVSEQERLGGGRLSAAATFLVSSNSLASDVNGQLSSGGGFGDFYAQPIIVGWKKPRADVRLAYGILAPTGRFDGDANDNVGSGYWTHAPSAGVTFYLFRSKSTAVSGFYMNEFHTTQQDTDIHPGQTANLDYSLTHTIPIKPDALLLLGLIGYGQWQMTDKSGPAITPAQASERYGVNSLGFASNLTLPRRKTTLGLKYFKEFASRSTFQGYTLQISMGIGF